MNKRVISVGSLLLVLSSYISLFFLTQRMSQVYSYLAITVFVSGYKLISDFRTFKIVYILYAMMIIGGLKMMFAGDLEEFISVWGLVALSELEERVVYIYIVLALSIIWADIVKYFVMFLRPSSK